MNPMPTYANLKNRRYQETPAQHRANPNMHVASVRIDIPQEIVPWSKDITTFKYESCTIQLEIWDSTVATIATYCHSLLLLYIYYIHLIIGILIVTIVKKSLVLVAFRWHEM